MPAKEEHGLVPDRKNYVIALALKLKKYLIIALLLPASIISKKSGFWGLAVYGGSPGLRMKCSGLRFASEP